MLRISFSCFLFKGDKFDKNVMKSRGSKPTLHAISLHLVLELKQSR